MINTIFNEDNLETLDRMPEDFIDLTITSPPYNVDLGNNKYNKNGYDSYDDSMPHNLYLQWLKAIFTAIFVKTKDGGRCVINIGDGKNGRVTTHSDIIQFMKEIGWLPYTTIVWNKQNIGNRTAWGSFMSASSPSFPTPFEYILVFCKNAYKMPYHCLEHGLKDDISKEDFIQWSLALWEFPGDNKNDHPAPFPIELPTRCLKLFSFLNSNVYDPFMGSGTTAVACIRNNRNYTGSEISETYYQMALKRIAVEVENQKSLF